MRLLRGRGPNACYDPPVGLVEILTGSLDPESLRFTGGGWAQKKSATLYQGIERRMQVKGENAMALKQGEAYRCPDAACGCAVTVTESAAPGKGGNLNPRCCCGKEMVKK